MSITLHIYSRSDAVRYAHTWALARNPQYYNYDAIGGDCTNFVSQCLYAGSGIMNYTPTFGWYYIDANSKSPSWTGVAYLYQFLTRTARSVGPAAQEVVLEALEPGDVVQLTFDGKNWQHTPLVISAEHAQSPDEVLVAAHSYDAYARPLSSYVYKAARFLHVTGVWKP